MASGAYQEPLASTELAQAARPDERHGRELYPRIIYLKTAVLFGTAVRLGAIATAASPATAALAFDLGVNVGEAYQIADDLHDLIELDAGTQDPAVLLPLVAPIVLHFCADARMRAPPMLFGADEEKMCGWFEKLRPLLRERMRQAIEARLRLAVSASQHLPGNRYTKLLETASAEIVQSMLNA
jgi:geranylgeranyl pyrophosphate synthase